MRKKTRKKQEMKREPMISRDEGTQSDRRIFRKGGRESREFKKQLVV